MSKIILGNLFRNALTALIVFLVTKKVIEADVAEKLMRGDTAELWGSGLSINLTMIVNVLVGLAVPIVVPIGLGIWGRIKHAYETIVARSQSFATSKHELKVAVAEASTLDIIKTVATEQPNVIVDPL